MTVRKTNSTFFTVDEGKVVLNVSEITDGKVVLHKFDVDAYALQLLANLWNAVNDQDAERNG